MSKPSKYSERENLSAWSLKYGQRESMSVKDDVQKCLNTIKTKRDNCGVKYTVHNPQFEEAVYMLKAEIKKIRARGRRSDNGLADWEEKDIAEHTAMIVKVRELQNAHAVYAEMKAEAGL